MTLCISAANCHSEKAAHLQACKTSNQEAKICTIATKDVREGSYIYACSRPYRPTWASEELPPAPCAQQALHAGPAGLCWPAADCHALSQPAEGAERGVHRIQGAEEGAVDAAWLYRLLYQRCAN